MTPVSAEAGSIDAPAHVLPQDAPLEKIALETYVALAKPSLIGLSRG